MFRTAHRSSSGALNCICSLWFIYPCGNRSLSKPVVVKAEPWQRPVTTWVHKPEAANTVCSSWWWAVSRSKHVGPSINFRIINSVTSCILLVFLLSLTTMHGSMNIISIYCFSTEWLRERAPMLRYSTLPVLFHLKTMRQTTATKPRTIRCVDTKLITSRRTVSVRRQGKARQAATQKHFLTWFILISSLRN